MKRSTQRTSLLQTGAFTLLEVVLTLSMAVVLMSLVGATLQFYTSNMNVRDADVRRVHLASSILQMISNDLRAALQGSTFDASTLESFLKAASPSGAGEAGAELDADAAETLGTTDPTAAPETETETTETADLVTSTLTLTKPGMIGNQTQIQFDISRLPRLEQWTQTISTTPGVLTDVPSDIKTVTYYVQAPGMIGGIADPIQGYLPANDNGTEQVAAGGLVRRELDRAATNYATETGGQSGLTLTGDLIATEVVSIGFEYFDGTNWQIQWNSDDSAIMPRAIRITLTLSDAAATIDPAALAAGVTAGSRTFIQTVKLPVAIAAATPAAETTDTTATDAASATGTTGTGTAGGASETGDTE